MADFMNKRKNLCCFGVCCIDKNQGRERVGKVQSPEIRQDLMYGEYYPQQYR